MDYLIIILVALIVAGLTFFSGFGLGTLLLPAFALFFPIETAIAATALVHFSNNILKLILMAKYGNLKVALKFLIPAVIFAAFGAFILEFISEWGFSFSYSLFNKEFLITPVKITIGILMIVFAYFEFDDRLKNMSFNEKMIPIGGMLSGFFGGLSGHQGALRTAFLIKAGLEKKEFIGTVVICSTAIDISRLLIYGFTLIRKNIIDSSFVSVELILAGAIAALIGTIIGKQLLEKITMNFVKKTVGYMLFILGFALMGGII